MTTGLVGQLGSALSYVFGFGAVARSRKRAAQQRASGSRTQTDFLDNLKELLARNAGAVQGGRVTILGLDRLKNRLGPRWEGLSDRVHAVARSALAKYLGPEDIWLALNDSYVIAFGKLDVEDAQTKCRMIGRMIEESLLGEGAKDGVAVTAAVATINGKIAFRELPSLEAMLSGLPTVSTSWPLEQEQARHAAAAMPIVAQPKTRASKPDSVEVVAVENGLSGDLAWEPIWDVRHERIPLYRAKYLPQATEDGTKRERDEATIAHEDIVVRDKALAELAHSVVDLRLIMLGLPVRYWTVASFSRRRDYLARLVAKTTPAMRKFLVIFLTEVPTGVPGSRLMELLAAFRPFCRELVVETAINTPDLVALTGSKVYAVGADLSGTTETEELLLHQLEQFAKHAAKAGVANCFLTGVKTLSLAIAAIGAGFRYVSGPVVGSPGPSVSTVRTFTLDELFRRCFEHQGFAWPEPEPEHAELRRTA